MTSTRIAIWPALACSLLAHAARGDDWDEEGGFVPPEFALQDTAIGGARPATVTGPAYLAGSRIAALPDGALVADADSGHLLRTDAKGARTGDVAIGAEVALLAYDPADHRAYVADRRGDRIVVIDVGERLRITATWSTPVEPYGVALTPDRKTLLVTTIADRTLVALDTKTGDARWRTKLDAEPRGIAISPDGTRALVASLSSGAIDQVSLGERPIHHKIALPTQLEGQHARAAFAVGFVGEMAVTPFQLDTPVSTEVFAADHYGGGANPPIAQQLAWLGPDGRHVLASHSVVEPRAITWDSTRDTLYMAGLASDNVLAIKNASQVDVSLGEDVAIGARCGADGLAVASDGALLVWCSFTRQIARLAPGKEAGTLAKASRGPELVASALDATKHEGMVLFHTANEHVSSFGVMSCGSCHLDGRADGLSWLIAGTALQTPVIAGRIADTAPYKWDGGAPDLPHSLRATVTRLGGTGLSKKDLASLTAFVEAMPAVRPPTRNPDLVARGKVLFESDLGCASCHEGSVYTDRDRHELTRGAGVFDTPGLAGLAASAPYFHDGSAATLEEVVRDRGRVHGMSDAARALTREQVAALTAFLETR